jgi:hypothetical protein
MLQCPPSDQIQDLLLTGPDRSSWTSLLSFVLGMYLWLGKETRASARLIGLHETSTPEKGIAGDHHLRHTVAVQTFPLRYPGNMLDPDALPRDSYTQVNNLLKLLELHLADAAIGLHLFGHWQLVPDLWSSDEVEQVQGCAHGHADVAYSYRLACIHAHTVLYALDRIQKALNKLAEVPGVPARLAEVRDAYQQALPSVVPVRNSAHHREDRVMGVGGGNRRLDPSNLLITSKLGPTRLGYTLGDGSYGEIEISRESVGLAWAAVQYAIEAFSWQGYPFLAPLR